MTTDHESTPTPAAETAFPAPQASSVRYAGFWIRACAALIDGLIMILPSLLLNSIFPIGGGILWGLLYKPFFESSVLQGTPGKAILGLQIVNYDLGRITFKAAFLRYIAAFASSFILGIGYLMAAFTEKKQTLHDILAETYVIHKFPPEGTNYLEAWINEIQKVFGFSNDSNNASTAPTNESLTKKLEELHDLHIRGLITEAEYNQKKEELLKRI